MTQPLLGIDLGGTKIEVAVLAPDDGVVSVRSATVGAVVAPGTELFRLIRQGRLEWRAEVAATDLARLSVGQNVRVQPVGGPALTGTVRMVAPTLDPQTRNALVYVDLPTTRRDRRSIPSASRSVVYPWADTLRRVPPRRCSWWWAPATGRYRA